MIRGWCSITVVALTGSQYLLGQASPLASWVTDVNPHNFSYNQGRVNALAINPANVQIIFAGSELGGVFKSQDGGGHWTHVDAVTMFQINDIKYVSTKPDVIIATGNYDGRVESMGGIWRSANGGVTWEKPRGSDPGCSSSLPFVPAGQTSAHRISFASDKAGPPRIFVADDCGIATSADFGATWSRIDPQPAQRRYWDVQATAVGGKIQLDTCGDDGYFRSSDGGAPSSWSAPDTPPYFRFFGTLCRIAVAPGDPKTVYIAGWFDSQLWEATGTGAPWAWTPLDTLDNIFGRPMSWVETHPGLDGDPNHFEAYFYGGWNVVHQTCSLASSPRCAPGVWNPLLGNGQFDAAAIVFDPASPNGPPILAASDQGVSSFQLGGRSVGLNALWVRPGAVAGSVFPDNTHLYFGTQDNGLWISTDAAASWSVGISGDIFELAANRTPPEQLAYTTLTGSSGVQLVGIPPPSGIFPPCDAPSGVTSHSTLTNFGPNSFALITAGTADCWDHLWVTKDSGVSWTQMGKLPHGTFTSWTLVTAAGPPSSPTFYLMNADISNYGIFRMAGPLDGSATLTNISSGLQFVQARTFAVSPADPNFLYASDIRTSDFRASGGTGQMMFTRDGGATWQPDAALTSLITHNGAFWYRSLIGYNPNGLQGFPGQPSAIAFDPTGHTILVGTHTAGIFASFDQGAHWQEVPGSEQIPWAAGFFFDDRTGAIFAGSAGRGMWRIDVPGRSSP